MSRPDPVEAKMVALLTELGLRFTRPDHDQTDPTNLDFFLPDLDLYVEVKQFHTPRISDQLAKVPPAKSVLVLVGPRSVEALRSLIMAGGCAIAVHSERDEA